MDEKKFILEMKDILETDDEININSELDSIEEWDSLSILSLIAFFDEKFSKKIATETIKDCKTIKDLHSLI